MRHNWISHLIQTWQVKLVQVDITAIKSFAILLRIFSINFAIYLSKPSKLEEQNYVSILRVVRTVHLFCQTWRRLKMKLLLFKCIADKLQFICFITVLVKNNNCFETLKAFQNLLLVCDNFENNIGAEQLCIRMSSP